MPSRRLPSACAALLLVVAAGCAAPVEVVAADTRDVYAQLTSFALNADAPSDDALVTLRRADLERTWEEHPVEALRTLHTLALTGDRRERLYALAELSYVAAERGGDRDLFVASSVYAHLFLFGGGPEPLPGPYRRRFRRACDLYGVALARAFTNADGTFSVSSCDVTLPVGRVHVAAPELPLVVDGFSYGELRPAIAMGVHGFRARAVRSGLGAPLVARRAEAELRVERRAHLAPNSALALTALLRVDGELEDAAGGLAARVEYHEPDGERDVEIAGQTVPVEFDVTAPLAFELNENRPWENEFGSFLDKDTSGVRNSVQLTEPYRRGRVPVLFVHGTASSPARWAEILNELHDDGTIAANCQFWIATYGSGAPILASAAGVRANLERVVSDLDPEGTDEALRQMVVIGHSQGGLLTRLLATESGDRFWHTLSDVAPDELELSDSERRYVQRLFFFEPSERVARVVYLATPHRGSHVAGSWIGRLGASLVAAPKAVVRGAGRLARRALGAGSDVRLDNFSTAVDDMSPGSAFLEALDASPLAARVVEHSIVAVDDDVPLAEGDDGVVDYLSAHRASAVSEVVVRSSHSCQQHPGTVAEIRRILRAHLRSLGR